MNTIQLSKQALKSIVLLGVLALLIENNLNAQVSCASPGTLSGCVSGNLKSAVGATPVPTCGSGTAYSVWRKFTAASTTASITISGFGSGLTASFIPYLQIFSGTCATLT